MVRVEKKNQRPPGNSSSLITVEEGILHGLRGRGRGRGRGVSAKCCLINKNEREHSIH